MTLISQYWENRYQQEDTPWDLGMASPPLVSFLSRVSKELRILIPGAGKAYEAELLFNKGYSNVYVSDFASSVLHDFASRVPNFPKEQLITGDFFEIEGTYDLIVEQTFFCALDPTLRIDYVEKMHELLSKKGKLAGLFFDFPLTEKGPPFGGNINLYKTLFKEKFHIHTLEPCYNSAPSRDGKELFFIFEKKE